MRKAAKPILLAAATVILLSAESSAGELWNPHLRGVDEGMAAGALPPKGVYFVDDSYWLSFEGHTSNQRNGAMLDGLVEVPILLWNPGVKFLDADYAMGIAQPFDYTSLRAKNGSIPGNGHWGTFNTILVPGILSWSLPSDFHVSTSLKVYVDDASSSAAHPPSTGGAGSGNSFWTLEPGVGLSWLHDGWNLSAEVLYDYNFKDTTAHVSNGQLINSYASGDVLSVDYTATKTFGKWTAGIGGYQQNQLQRDVINGVSTAGTTRLTYGLGPIVGYNFGPVDLTAFYNYNITTHNDFGGDIFNVRLLVPF